jgi:hypothetical protein
MDEKHEKISKMDDITKIIGENLANKRNGSINIVNNITFFNNSFNPDMHLKVNPVLQYFINIAILK